MTGRWLGLGVLLVLGVVGYRWWLDLTRGARALGEASAMVTLSDKRADCAVKRDDGKPGDMVPCNDVSTYLRDKLNLSPGASVGIAVLGKVSPDTVTAVSSELSARGFKVAGVIRVGFITEPGNGAR
jgi:hypothetical protein